VNTFFGEFFAFVFVFFCVFVEANQINFRLASGVMLCARYSGWLLKLWSESVLL
jgi:hypothetical protein